VFSHCHGQLIFVDSSFRFASCHCWREAAYTLAAAEDDVAERVLEGRGRVEAVGAAVVPEDGSILRRPFNLQNDLSASRKAVLEMCGG
jgi:hypothetical protein